MLGQRRRRWPDIETASTRSLVSVVDTPASPEGIPRDESVNNQDEIPDDAPLILRACPAPVPRVSSGTPGLRPLLKTPTS